jgi:hypothetical protein
MKGSSLRDGAALKRITLGSACALALLAGSAAIAQAKSVNVNDTVSLHLVKKSGSTLIESGMASGTLPGSVSARIVSTPFKVTGSVTIHPRGGGSVTINVVGTPKSPAKIVTVTGTLGVRSGTGRYRRATGSGTFTATVNRGTWAATVNTKAKLNY